MLDLYLVLSVSLLGNVAGGRGTRGLYPGSNEDAEQHDIHAGC